MLLNQPKQLTKHGLKHPFSQGNKSCWDTSTLLETILYIMFNGIWNFKSNCSLFFGKTGLLQKELAKSITQEQGKTLIDAEGDVLRGLHVVEHCCSVISLQLGETMPNMHCQRYGHIIFPNSLERLCRNHSLQLPCHFGYIYIFLKKSN